ncbi:hypothetical protein FACS1894190_08360 [Spirochaetia bacterium]|nr:hypothetical protein FACS1894190_08360 [Spirochaetia bacterium]
MATNKDWLPKTRTEQLAMAKDWLAVLATEGAAWKITEADKAELAGLVEDAGNAIAVEKNETTRTPVAIAQCKTAFEAMIAKMRDMKKRFFYVPPLTDADLVSLGLKIPDHTPTASGTPTAQATIETYLVGRHELGIKIIYVTGNPADPANKGFRIWYSVVAQGETPPASLDDYTNHSLPNGKKK